jgi:hypothetical protein
MRSCVFGSSMTLNSSGGHVPILSLYSVLLVLFIRYFRLKASAVAAALKHDRTACVINCKQSWFVAALLHYALDGSNADRFISKRLD